MSRKTKLFAGAIVLPVHRYDRKYATRYATRYATG